jgi:hypothetical protein
MAKKQIANESPVATAERALRELQEKYDRVSAARAEDDREMGRVSLAAHSGDAEASKRLDTVVERMLRRDLELKSITSAIAAAQHNLVEARADEAAADQRRVALEVRSLLKSLRDAGAVCDNALAEFAAGSNAMKEIIQRINALGFHHPSAMQLVSLGERAVRGTLVNSPFARAFETIAPRERQNFNDFTGQWLVALEREIAARLGEIKPKEAVA